MMHVEVIGPSAEMARVATAIDRLDGVRGVRRIDAIRPGHSVVAASARPSAIDPLLDELMHLHVPERDIAIIRAETVEWTATRRSETSPVWADVLGQAWINARPIARYLTLMFAAGRDLRVWRARPEQHPDRRRDGGQPRH